MEIIYCSKWWLKKKCALNVFKAEEACKKHNNGQPYSAVIIENNMVKYVLDIGGNYVIVRFMNSAVLPYLIYEFTVEEKGNIFLKIASYYKYDSEKKIESMTFNFQSNGKIMMEKRNFANDEVEEKVAIDDVKGNWDKYPKFGDYSSLLKEER